MRTISIKKNDCKIYFTVIFFYSALKIYFKAVKYDRMYREKDI